jgi:hypothetical protein
VAAIRGPVGIVRLLLEYGVNRLVPALIDAVKNGHEDVARLLLDTPGDNIDVIEMLHGGKSFLRNRDKCYSSRCRPPMSTALDRGDISMVRFLLRRCLSCGGGPSRYGYYWDWVKAVELLLENNSRPEISHLRSLREVLKNGEEPSMKLLQELAQIL